MCIETFIPFWVDCSFLLNELNALSWRLDRFLDMYSTVWIKAAIGVHLPFVGLFDLNEFHSDKAHVLPALTACQCNLRHLVHKLWSVPLRYEPKTYFETNSLTSSLLVRKYANALKVHASSARDLWEKFSMVSQLKYGQHRTGRIWRLSYNKDNLNFNLPKALVR